ncbi:uncharacterized protein [Nicotiana sylvestris]|uniref:uncharacterized protein n=1 Tax=Nicotiana sylvestris TaxID=4096 RepID=UPI00388C844E
MKAQALADHLSVNPVDEEYEPLGTYFPDEEVMHIDEVEQVEKPGWKLFFDGAANMKGVGIGYEAYILGLRLAVDMGIQEVLVLGDSNLLVHHIQGEWETWDLKLIPYRQCLHDLCQRFQSIEFRHIPRIHNEVADTLDTLASMLHHLDKAYVNPLYIQVCDQHTYCNMVKEELDGEPWFYDIREYIRMKVYPVRATCDQKRTIWHLASGYFLSGRVLYKRTPDLGLLRCINAKKAMNIMTEVHRDLNHSPPSKLHTMCAPRPFVAWGMDFIGPIEPAASKGHRFFLVAIDYFTKWVEAKTFKSVTKKVVVNFVHSNIICRFRIPKVIITDNGANLNNYLMKEVCQQFKIMHRNSTTYRPKANGAVEVANKNIKKILQKMGQEISFIQRNPPWGKHAPDRHPPGKQEKWFKFQGNTTQVLAIRHPPREQGKTSQVSKKSSASVGNQAPTWRIREHNSSSKEKTSASNEIRNPTGEQGKAVQFYLRAISPSYLPDVSHLVLQNLRYLSASFFSSKFIHFAINKFLQHNID